MTCKDAYTTPTNDTNYSCYIKAIEIIWPIIWVYILGLSNYRDSIHYCDSLTLFMNKIVDYWTIWIEIHWDTYQLHWQKFSEIYKTWSALKTTDKFMPFVHNHGIKELITHYRDSIHNCEYQNFYYCDSIIFTIA